MKKETEDLLKAIDLAEGATEPLQKSQMALDFAPGPNPHDHHRAYERHNASGTVSQIAAKGDNALHDAVVIANRRRSEAWAASSNARIPVHHRDAMTAHLRAAEAMDEISAHQDADQHRQKAAEHEQKWHLHPTVTHTQRYRTTAEMRDHHYERARFHEAAAEQADRDGDINGSRHHADKADEHTMRAEAMDGRLPEATPMMWDENGRMVIAESRILSEADLRDIAWDVKNAKEHMPLEKMLEEAAREEEAAKDFEERQNDPHAGAYKREYAKQMREAAERMQTAVKPTKVHVDTSPHRRSHMREPKGRGGWFFSKHKDINFGVHKEGEDYISTPSMTYGEAKKYAKEWAAKKGHSTIYVMP